MCSTYQRRFCRCTISVKKVPLVAFITITTAFQLKSLKLHTDILSFVIYTHQFPCCNIGYMSLFHPNMMRIQQFGKNVSMNTQREEFIMGHRTVF